MMGFRDTERLERVLSHRGSAWAMWAAVLPFILLVLLLGRVTYEVSKRTAPVITRMLAPPVTRPPEQLDFSASAPTAAVSAFAGDFAVDLKEEFAMPAVADDLPAPETPAAKAEAPDVTMNDADFADDAFRFDASSFADPGAAAADTKDAAVGGDEPQADSATLLRAGRERRAVPTARGHGAGPGGAVTAGDKSVAVGAEPGLGEAVHLAARPASGGTGGSGAGVARPAGREKLRLAGWILKNQAPLRPAVQEALGFSREKADRTAAGSVVDASGRLYQLFFLHRTGNNLLRILVVSEGRAWRIDLPDFYLEANHVKVGRAVRGPGDPGPIIEVSLESVDKVPAEVPGVFDLVLQWLDIKGKE